LAVVVVLPAVVVQVLQRPAGPAVVVDQQPHP
jgi:hypothetical protein